MRKLKMSTNWTHQQSRLTIDTQDVLTISILTVMKTSINKSINHDSLFKQIDHQFQSFKPKIEIGCTGYEFIPVFQVRLTRSLFWCVCFVDRYLSFCTSFAHCVVCSSSIYGFRLPFGIFKLFYIISYWKIKHPYGGATGMLIQTNG
jgi:hypothetical protein